MLTEADLRAGLGERPVRFYPAVLSTEADALAWARADAPDGAVVAAAYQVAPRGRGGLEWHVDPDHHVAFSVVLRPELPAGKEGWAYTMASLAVCDVVGDDAVIHWPDEIYREGQRQGAVGMQSGIEAGRVTWVVVNVLAPGGSTPGETVGRVLSALERRRNADTKETLEAHRQRLATLGRRVRARLIPMGPAGVAFTGDAEATRDDGSLVLRTDEGAMVRVMPQNLGVLEDPPLEDPPSPAAGDPTG